MNQKADANKMRDKYDFSAGVRGNHYKAYRDGTNGVLLDPEVARVFRDSESVNQGLKMLIELADERGAEKPNDGIQRRLLTSNR